MRYVALLRGIAPTNPNMHQAKLCGVMEHLGFGNVRGVISSGNVVFESRARSVPRLEATIEKAWPQELGFRSTTIVRSEPELRALVELDPFAGMEHGPTSNLNVTFLKRPTETDLTLPYRPRERDWRILGMTDREVFSVIDVTSARTPDLMVWAERRFGTEITTRTWKTVLRILARMG